MVTAFGDMDDPRRIQAQVLGPLLVSQGGEAVHPGGTKQRTVLAALLLARGAWVPNPRLERILWGDEPPGSAHAQIQTYVYKLRKLLGPDRLLLRQGFGYALSIGAEDLDLSEFERQTERARRALAGSRASEATAELRSALALWRGPALADVTEHLRRIEQPRLEELRLAALEDRIDADLQLVHENELVPELTGLVAEYPLRERLRGQLMLALYRSGRRADALGVYRSGRRVLLEETGLEFGERLRRLHDAILADKPGPSRPYNRPPVIESPAEVTFAEHPETVDVVRPAQLPPIGLDLVGRDKEIAFVLGRCQASARSRQLWAVPVCVITGMAGVGKTALAAHAAQRLRDEYPDGQLYSDLRGLDPKPASSAEVLLRFLQALGVDTGTTTPTLEESLALYRSRVADRRILVVLDNASSAAQIRPLLPAGSGCAVIVTCRTRLSGVDGADLVDLDVLEVDEAVELIARIAGSRRVEAEPRVAEQIARMCDCLPLAVSIAGARLAARPHWSLSRLAHRLAGAGDRLRELSHDDMDLRSSLLRGSQNLPGEALRAWRLLAHLQVPHFASWVVALLLSVSSDTAEELVDALVDARLLEVVPTGRGPCAYYRFRGLVHAAAREQGTEFEPPDRQRAMLGQAFGAWLALAREAERRLVDRGRTGSASATSRRLPDPELLDDLLSDPIGWFEAERPILDTVVTQAKAENRRVLASELGQVLGRLERLVPR